MGHHLKFFLVHFFIWIKKKKDDPGVVFLVKGGKKKKRKKRRKRGEKARETHTAIAKKLRKKNSGTGTKRKSIGN